MPFTWTANVEVDDAIEGHPTAIGDVRELRINADWLKQNICSTYYNGVLTSEKTSEDTGDETAAHTCTTNYGDNAAECGSDLTYYDNGEDDTAQNSQVNDQTSDDYSEVISVKLTDRNSALVSNCTNYS